MSSAVNAGYGVATVARVPVHEPGQAGQAGQDGSASGLAGYSWGEYVAHLVAEHGSLAAVALRLAERATTPEDSASVERALRRLRQRGNLDGGDYGRRLLRVFGLPRPIEARVKWMGVYHSRFCDLPRSLCREQLRLWDRPPINESRARVWIELGLASAALRGQELEQAALHLRRARAAKPGEQAARVELALVEGFLASRQHDHARVEGALAEAQAQLESDAQEDALAPEERACLRVRWVDQRAYQLNNPRDGATPDWRVAMALYAALPAGELHPFVGYRRDAGLAYAHYKLGERDAAIRLTTAAIEHAGDGGYLRLRVMGLHLLARILGEQEGAPARARALAIARRLEDEELLGRLARAPAAR